MNLKLAIYTIDVRHKHKSDKLNFEEAFKKISTIVKTKEEYYQDFIKRYIKSFDGKFSKVDDTSKSITTDDISFLGTENIIYGMIRGGLTNVELDIFESDNITTPVGKLNKNQIAAQPYFFLLYTPYDKSHGVLMIQYYSVASVTTSFKNNLQSFFREHEITLTMYPFVPEKKKKEFLKTSVINKISLSKTVSEKTARSKFNPLILEEDQYEIVIEFRKIKQDPASFVTRITDSLSKNKSLFSADLSDLGIEGDDDYLLKVFYENEEGKQSHSNIKKGFDIFPTIDLPNELKESGKDSPDLEKMKDYSVKLLTEIKDEIL
jgi:hypothetical protein